MSDDNTRQSLAREPATADVGRDMLGYTSMRSGGRCDWRQLREAVSEAIRGNREVEQDERSDIYTGHRMVEGMNYNSLDRIVTAFVDAALSRAAPSSGHAMAEGWSPIVDGDRSVPLLVGCWVESEGEPRRWSAWTVWPDEPLGCDGAWGDPPTHCQPLPSPPDDTTPPTTNDATPAGMVAQAVALCERYGEVSAANEQGERDAGDEVQAAVQMGAALAAFNLAGMIRALSTPKPSPTPKGGLPGRGEVQWRTDMDAAKHGRSVVLNSDSPLWRYPFVGFWNAATGWWDFSDPNLSGCFAVSELVNQWAPLPAALAPAEAIRDGGEGGEG